MSQRLHVLEIHYSQGLTALLLFCVSAAWFLALLFVWALMTQHMSTREFYMIAASLPVFIGLTAFASYKCIRFLGQTPSRMTLSPDSLLVRYKSGKEYVYPLAYYSFSRPTPTPNSKAATAPLTGFEIQLPVDQRICLDNASRMIANPGSNPCSLCEYYAPCGETGQGRNVLVPVNQERELDVLHNKLLEAQNTLRQPEHTAKSRVRPGRWKELSDKAGH